MDRRRGEGKGGWKRGKGEVEVGLTGSLFRRTG